MDDKERTVRGAIFYRSAERMIGTKVLIHRKDADGGEPEFVQEHLLISMQDYARKKDGHKTTLFEWSSHCTDCGEVLTFTGRNMTKDLQRRCRQCREDRPYDPEGWRDRPRNIYTRILPGDGEAWVSPTHGKRIDGSRPGMHAGLSTKRWPLYDALGEDKPLLASAKRAELGGNPSVEQVRDAIEADLRAAQNGDIDPESLF